MNDEEDEGEEEDTTHNAAAPAEQAKSKEEIEQERAAGGVFKTKKGKLANKTAAVTQAKILTDSGVPEALVPKFVDPKYWLEYFPPYGMSDLLLFGSGNDFRRSFITTDANPYYDAFIRWQFNILKAEGLIKFGRRESVFDPISNQPCADHDRASGEGVGPQQYTLIKMEVQAVPSAWTEQMNAALKPEAHSNTRKVFFVCATLRPETMCGQTNCFVQVEGEYGCYLTKSGEVFIVSEQAGSNLVYQDVGMELEEAPVTDETKALLETQYEGYGRKPVCLLKILGKDLVGTPLSAPLSPFATVYALPMFGVLMNKGTGVVTSVPADAPDDYAALMDWKTKPKLRDQYNVKEEWCVPFNIVNIVNTPELGDCCSELLIKEFKVESQKDADKLKKCKEKAYKVGFYSGKMIAGPFCGEKVADAKLKTTELLIKQNLALRYYEPESEVMARTGAKCIVAFCDQWFIDYANEEWTTTVREYVQGEDFTGYTDSTRNNLIKTIDWMKEWACSRTFGLGSLLPWDKQWVGSAGGRGGRGGDEGTRGRGFLKMYPQFG